MSVRKMRKENLMMKTELIDSGKDVSKENQTTDYSIGTSVI